MSGQRIRENRWAVILAGGEGVRLRSLARLVSGDDRPKQFCPLLSGRTLLARTRERTARGFTADQTAFVLLKAHERFYSDELPDVPPSRMIIQPRNRGTLPAVLYSLLRIMEADPEAVVAFFPSDHYYADERTFMAGVDLAFSAAEGDRDSVIMLAAPASHPETEYGWIEAEAALSSQAPKGFLRVKRFWEKPTPQAARDLLDRGAVWNTFVTIGRARAFWDVIRSRELKLCQSFEFAHAQPDRDVSIHALYENLPVSDLSSQVWAASPERLGVVCLGEVGWSDLGNPGRLIDVLSRNGEKNEWLPIWQKRPESRTRGAGAGEAVRPTDELVNLFGVL
jgi:mannose-1-phosphate guanylyltransferase